MKKKIWPLRHKVIQYLQKEYDSILLLIGLTLLFYLCMNLVRAQFIYNSATIPKYRFSKEYTMSGNWTSDMLDETSDWFEGRGYNCSIRCLGGKVGNSLEVGEFFIYLSAEELAKKEKISLEKWNEKKNAILIDGELTKFTYRNHGDTCILINDMEYVVFDIINEVELLGQSSYANWKNMDEDHRQTIIMALMLDERKGVESNRTFQVERLTQFDGQVDEFFKLHDVGLQENFNFQGAYDMPRKYLALKTDLFYVGMVVMGICSLHYILSLWVLRRKRELMIRRMLGFNFWRLVKTLMKECFWITLLSFIIAMALEIGKIGFSVARAMLWHRVTLAIFYSAFISLLIELSLVVFQTLTIIKIYPTHENIEMAGE